MVHFVFSDDVHFVVVTTNGRILTFLFGHCPPFGIFKWFKVSFGTDFQQFSCTTQQKEQKVPINTVSATRQQQNTSTTTIQSTIILTNNGARHQSKHQSDASTRQLSTALVIAFGVDNITPRGVDAHRNGHHNRS